MAPSPQMDLLETQIYYAFGIAGNLAIEGITIEQVLFEILEKRGLKKWWDPFQKNLLTDKSLEAIFDALGKIGTKESTEFLNKLQRSLKGSLAQKLNEALTKIGERTNKGRREQ